MNTPYFPFWPRFNIDDQGRAVVGPGSYPPFARQGEAAAAPAGTVAGGRTAPEPARELAPPVTTHRLARRGGA